VNAPCTVVGIAEASVPLRPAGDRPEALDLVRDLVERAMSRPTRADATSDITTSTGIDPAYDSTSGVSAFVAPGPS